MGEYSDPRTVCAAWLTEEELCCADDGSIESCNDEEATPLTYTWSNEDLILAASNMLYARTGYRYPGQCEIEVYPCADCHCSCHPCACGTFSALRLPTDYPIISVDTVSIDGEELDENAFRLDRSQWLVRMDGQRWPSCNSFGLPNSSSHEIIVEATVGREPPIELKMAAADLACELKKACNGSDSCALPPHVRNLTRRGVEIEIDDITSLFKDGLFGIPSVDMAIKIHSVHHHGSVFDPTDRSRGYGA